jgi:ankyrin repeat protein
MYIAAAGGKIEVLKELLNRNANFEAKNDNGDSPLMLGIFFNLLNHLYNHL